jgi:CheY-like chemotaxis protein
MAKAILLVEDSDNDEFIFLQVLKKTGISNPIYVVRDGAEAIRYLNGEEQFADRKKFPMVNVMFLDLKMPGMGGFEVLQWLKGQGDKFKNLLVVVLSHFGETKDINQAYGLGAHSFLTKPIKAADLAHLAEHFKAYWQNGAGI